ncbi:receptor-like protein kinase HSL1 [Tanacetum coccineum]
MTEANLIGEIPGNLSGMVAMELLDLSNSRSIEAWNMEIIDLSANKLTGKIPNGFGTLTREIPDWLWKFSRLDTVFLERNQFTGELPAAISNK